MYLKRSFGVAKEIAGKDYGGFQRCFTETEKEIFFELCNRLSDNLDRIREEEKALHASVIMLRKEKDKAELEVIQENDQIG